MTEYKPDPEEVKKYKAMLHTVSTGPLPKDPNAAFNLQLEKLIRSKEQAGWSRRQIRRFVKREFNINLEQ